MEAANEAICADRIWTRARSTPNTTEWLGLPGDQNAGLSVALNLALKISQTHGTHKGDHLEQSTSLKKNFFLNCSKIYIT